MSLSLSLGLGLSQRSGVFNIANPIPASTEWTEISPGVWQCTGNNVGAATTLFLAQDTDGLVIGQAYLLSATITGTADILIRSGSTTLDTNWDGSPKIFIPMADNFNIFQRAGGYTIEDILIREAVITALGVTSLSEVGSPAATILATAAIGVESASETGTPYLSTGAPAATGVESASEVGAPTATILAPAAIGVESASEVGIPIGDTTAPVMTLINYNEETFTFSANLSEAATLHFLVTDTEPTTANDIILGTGLLKTTMDVEVGANEDYVELSTVAAGTHWLGVIAVDAFNNSDFAQSHVDQYAFPGGYVATGVESASEVGSPAAATTVPDATGVESASEVGAPTVTIQAPAATGIESAGEVGSPSATIQATVTIGVESASEVGTPTATILAPVATGIESASEVGSPAAPETTTTDFVFTVQTTGASETFAIVCVDPSVNNGGTFNATIDWGDGGGTSAVTAYNDADLSHIYATADTYEIRISGEFPNIRFRDNATHRAKVRTVTNLGTVGWKSLYGAFGTCSGMTSFTAGNTNTSAVADFGRFMESCSSLTTCNLSGMSTAACTSMRSMFDGVSSLTSLDVSGFDTSLVTDFRYQFQNMNAVTSLDVTGFDTGSGQNFEAQFRYTNNLATLDPSGFDITAINSATAFANWKSGSAMPTASYTNVLINFEAQTPMSGVTLNVGTGTFYTSGAASARSSLTGTYTWSITDGGQV